MEWLSRHGSDVAKPLLRSVVDALKEEGVTKLGIVGYCYGGEAWTVTMNFAILFAE